MRAFTHQLEDPFSRNSARDTEHHSQCLFSSFPKRALGKSPSHHWGRSVDIAQILGKKNEFLTKTIRSYALFKAKDKKLLDDEDLDSRLQSADKINTEYVAALPSRATIQINRLMV